MGVCLEILDRLHKHIFELANAVQLTSGQAFVMAFQAGGAHALDRALEAIAYAYAEMTRHPGTAGWEKAAGKGDPLRMAKTFHVVPRGVALVIGCNTFPTWNSYPGLFASLVTGNPVIVKPHPRAVLPLAITVKYAREVLAEAGFDPNLVMLAAEAPGEKLASDLALHRAVKIVDFTGSTEFGDWLETHARQASVYTEKAGVNTVVIDSTDDFAGMCRNLGFSLTLYSGQMCTTSQNILIPAGGIETDQGHKSFDEVAGGIAAAVGKLTADPARGVELTGAIVNDGVLERLAEVTKVGEPVLESRAVAHPAYADAVVRTPTIVKLAADDAETYGREWFGPISFAIATDSTAQQPGAAAPDGRREGRADRRGLLHRRGGAGRHRGGRGRGRGAPVLQPHRRGLREPVGGVLRLPRQRGQPGGQLGVDRWGLRGQPVPDRAVPAARLSLVAVGVSGAARPAPGGQA